MFWPIILPLKITFWLLVGIVLVGTLVSPVLHWKRHKTFWIASLFACVVFIPSCVGITFVLDARRFGTFQYDTFSAVQDFRIERYLPTSARDITLQKFGAGHRAKYTLTQPELTAYLDALWRKADGYSSMTRDELDDGATLAFAEFAHNFAGLDWPALETVVQFHSPVQANGGGATYYFDVTSNVVYHRAGYW